MKENSDDFSQCIEICSADKTCFGECFNAFLEKADKCPCMDQCELGCPCENGYACESFISAISENTNTLAGFSYVISSDGHMKENRFYKIPEAEGNLRAPGFSLLNGKMYIFGGYQDETKVPQMSICCS